MPACVLRSSQTGEADKYLSILTSDLGVIGAKAKAVRHLRSKLRFSIQDYAFFKATFVKGKTGWRLTNAGESLPALSPKKTQVFARIAALISILADEAPGTELFSILVDAYNFLLKNNLNHKEAFAIECICSIKILANLGYMPDRKELKSFEQRKISKELLDDFESVRKIAINTINTSIEATHLTQQDRGV